MKLFAAIPIVLLSTFAIANPTAEGPSDLVQREAEPAPAPVMVGGADALPVLEDVHVLEKRKKKAKKPKTSNSTSDAINMQGSLNTVGLAALGSTFLLLA